MLGVKMLLWCVGCVVYNIVGVTVCFVNLECTLEYLCVMCVMVCM